MSLFIGLGSNLQNKTQNLVEAKEQLLKHFDLIAESRIYTSKAQDYTNQPDFFNQVIEFKSPSHSPHQILDILISIERDMGRIRNIPKGPRIIDLDILFLDNLTLNDQKLEIPHPRSFKRSFVLKPLSELPGFKDLCNFYSFDFHFDEDAFPVQN